MVTSGVVTVERHPFSVRWACSGAIALVVAGACLRLAFNNVRRFGNGDEFHYRLQVAAIDAGGWSHYPELVRWHLTNEPDFPAPYRWGNLLFGRLACSVRHACDERSLAWVSTLSGILVVALVALLAHKLFARKTAYVATALAITSPLHLELGRRAYADELHTALLLLTLLSLTHVAAPRSGSHGGVRSRMWVAASLASLTLAWSVKESVAFMLPAFAIWLFSLRSPGSFRLFDVVLLLTPPILALAGFAALNHGFANLGALYGATQASLLHPYSIAFQAGPPHRPLIELFTLSPWVYGVLPVVPFVAWGITHPSGAPGASTARSHARALIAASLLLLAAFAFLPKNLRFCALFDPLARLLVAWLVCEVLPLGRRGNALWCASIVLGNAALELAVCHRAFAGSSVTDPTASAIFSALQMIPGEVRSWHPPWLVNWVAASSSILAWAAARKARFTRTAVVSASLVTAFALLAPQMLRPKRARADVIHPPAAVTILPQFQSQTSSPEGR